MNEQMTLKEASETLGVKSFRISYAIANGYVPEPKRFGNRRVFGREDLKRLAAYFEIDLNDREGGSDV